MHKSGNDIFYSSNLKLVLITTLRQQSNSYKKYCKNVLLYLIFLVTKYIFYGI